MVQVEMDEAHRPVDVVLGVAGWLGYVVSDSVLEGSDEDIAEQFYTSAT